MISKDLSLKIGIALVAIFLAMIYLFDPYGGAPTSQQKSLLFFSCLVGIIGIIFVGISQAELK